MILHAQQSESSSMGASTTVRSHAADQDSLNKYDSHAGIVTAKPQSSIPVTPNKYWKVAILVASCSTSAVLMAALIVI